MSIPPGVTVPVSYGPDVQGDVWVLYHLTFGDVAADAFGVKCSFKPAVFGGMFVHECSPMNYDVIDPGCILWCPLMKGAPYKVEAENLTGTPQTFIGRMWQLNTNVDNMRLISEAYDRFVLGAPVPLAEVLSGVKKVGNKLDKALEDLTMIRKRLCV